MAKQNREHKGPEGFDRFYRDMYGPRWDDLHKALAEEPKAIAFTDGLTKPYFLDYGSFLAASSLETAPGETVLDLCAAPGGKSLVLAAGLSGRGRLVCNDRSAGRRKRLLSVLDEHLPPEERRIVTVTGHDAARWCLYEQNAYDKVLADVPCSSERHIVRSPKHLNQWSPARTKHLAVQAYAILASAVRTLKPGGLLVYSTCTVSEHENDGVIRKLIKKFPDGVDIDIPATGPGSVTSFGRIILPDTDGGNGPMYICRLRKSLMQPISAWREQD